MQVGPLQVGPVQVGPLQVRPVQVRPVQVGPVQVGPVQVGLYMLRMRSAFAAIGNGPERLGPNRSRALTWSLARVRLALAQGQVGGHGPRPDCTFLVRLARITPYEMRMRSAISSSGTRPKGMRTQLAWK